MKNGIFIVAELPPGVRERVSEIQRAHDPKLAALSAPHVTLVGSSGVGPLSLDTTAADLRARLGPIAESTAPITVHFGPPMQFMQTDIVVLPLDPHGPLRALHERIATSGLYFERPRFSFSPHCTLNFFKRLTPERRRQLFAIRITEPFTIGRFQCYRTAEPEPARKVLELELTGG